MILGLAAYAVICLIFIFNMLGATNQKVAGSIPDGGHWIFQLTLSFQPHCDPGVDSASNRNEYQESSWG
jgi:hypothetical protein